MVTLFLFLGTIRGTFLNYYYFGLFRPLKIT